ncbi:MAG: hypothetical protein AUI53_00860 [Acidobacteria bacterium 13_1_40CM_2_60_7]|nr:MAG: hypothetical protein AUI53_00860 [Acidobacteria bacterium 13_1_40CM_2_60_7]PYU08107.1 MAG: hypothetical protein DMG33_02655 [Acidobacteriota bacterium]
MYRRAICALAVVLSLAVPAAVRAQENYLDVFTVKVKPEKSADFQAIAKKIADANRRFNGDHFMAIETMYGDSTVISFVSTRESYADVDKANDAFMGALQKAYGKEAAAKLLQDVNNCSLSQRSELRRRRWDLSRKAPVDAAAYANLIGGSRVLRTTAVHLRPGHVAEFEALLKDMKAAGEQAANTQPVLVSQVVEGGKGATFYITTLRTGLGGFDKNPTAHDILGEEGYKKYLQVNAESVESTESTLYRFSPTLSNPPEEILAVAPDFWQPKALMAAASKPAAKPKGLESKPVSEKPKH